MGQKQKSPPNPALPGADYFKPICMKPSSIVHCIDDSKWSVWAKRTYSSLAVKGEYYTIREIFSNIYRPDGTPGITLEEIRGEWSHYTTYYGVKVYMERHFKATRFKEVLPPFDNQSKLLQSEKDSTLITIK
jgi:hypothetical protein